ncbi:hypothetical protein O53_3785 [Microcystis aeruginosa TAIHU98]|uniref:Uncharacterized protein n=1 Tax=Microcystis aeruginosa TAIHU98 TaxID=1134457 RepID=L7E9K1_MICAE|nr:hypothetical protein O53_3785 [Microcystis aeruginosa TAIHU98]
MVLTTGDRRLATQLDKFDLILGFMARIISCLFSPPVSSSKGRFLIFTGFLLIFQQL